MVNEIVALSDSLPAGHFLDATVGGAGHSRALLESNDDLVIVGIDQDPAALRAAHRNLEHFEDRFELVRCRFDRFMVALEERGIDRLVGFLFDLGVSSPQLDIADRGFSFRHEGPLDMRMDPESSLDAAHIVNNYDQRHLARVLKTYGDERFATRIAAAIVAKRPLTSTVKLAEVIVDAIPAAARRTGGHPAKRSFQALRIEVNAELQILAPTLQRAIELLAPGGKGFVLTYHSGEDRIVKDVIRSTTTPVDPPDLPVEHNPPAYRPLRPLARRPQPDEVETNRRARSARLRGIERIAA